MTSIAFNPSVPWWVIGGIALVALGLLVSGAMRSGRGVLLRAGAFAIALAALANPSLVEEQRETLNDVAVIVADESLSQNIGDRRARTAEAVAALQKQLEALGNLEVRVVHADTDQTTEIGRAHV